MKTHLKLFYLFILGSLGLLLFVFSFNIPGIFFTRSNALAPGTIVIPVTNPPGPTEQTMQLRTFSYITVTPSPVFTSNPGGPVTITKPEIGGPCNASDPCYCIDDVDPDMCDDNSSYHVPKGSGGSQGSCGTVIEQAHKLVNALPQYMKGLRNSLTKSVSNCNYSTGPASNYVSTHFVIDAYNLAGFKELSKNNAGQVSPSGLLSWWQSQPAGYKFIPYSASVIQQYKSGQQNLTGCAMFLKTASSYHIGIVNAFELYTEGGDGVISILQAGTRMYIDRFPVSGWNVSNASTNQTSTNGVVGFGCHT